jgi:hypothetical protein
MNIVLLILCAVIGLIVGLIGVYLFNLWSVGSETDRHFS